MRKSPRNKTIQLTNSEKQNYRLKLHKLKGKIAPEDVVNTVINQDIFQIINFLPHSFIDLLFIDPPYNISKNFHNRKFKGMEIEEYKDWMDSWLRKILHILRPTASVYICGDWRSSAVVHLLCDRYLTVRNRITFEREKGRGSKRNWKNNSEDIWFCTVSDDYYFNPEKVKMKRRVMAPYREEGKPKDWKKENNRDYRLTYPSNIWTDITIPFWSMKENTPHSTQKPEKLLAKVILASSKRGDTIFDPFAGVGTTGVVARKLERNFVMVEIEEEYCLYALKRLEFAEEDRSIQGYSNGIFWERNTRLPKKRKKSP
jgi:site-specific DNA-methyltransferase (adenine-specific)